MIPIKQTRRVLKIATVLARYRLDEILDALRIARPIKYIRMLPGVAAVPSGKHSRGERIRLALQELGPIFVKFGQILSTRRDLLPPDVADELAKLQDQVEPFSSEQAVAQIEQALDGRVAELFATFDDQALASASIAQVHAAQLQSGEQVVVKVLRPGIRQQVERDVELLKTIAATAERYSEHGRRITPTRIVAELEKTIYYELDLLREAANASQLRRNFSNDKLLYVPKVYFDLCRPKVMVMERVSGIPIDNVERLRAANVDIQLLAERGIKIFYTQVFRDNFFHADMHPGNILVDASDPADPTYIALDFGIVGTLPPAHLYYLGENFAAFFNQDYRRVAALHIESGWIPDTVRIDELESAVRTVCEPQFEKPLSEISFAMVLWQLFEVARQFDLVVQPELVLLQKTLLNIEGIGRHLYPQLDVWATSKPVLEQILRDRQGLEAVIAGLRDRLPGLVEKAPEMPALLYDFLKQSHDKARADALQMQQQSGRSSPQDRLTWATLAGGAMLSATVWWGLDVPSPRWFDVALWPALLTAFAGLALWKAWPRR